MRFAHPKLVTFSGIDGAGKSTQIQALESNLWELGFRSRLYAFWDDVVVLSRFREHVSHSAFKGDAGIGSPERPINRRDKNVQSWYVTAARLVLYLLDALRLRRFVKKITRSGCDYIIFDRYIYDELANLPLNVPFMRTYVRFVLWLAPTPEIAYLIDADPEAARKRKPEYPLDFLRKNRDAYIALSCLVEPMHLVGADAPDNTASTIMKSISMARIRHGSTPEMLSKTSQPKVTTA